MTKRWALLLSSVAAAAIAAACASAPPPSTAPVAVFPTDTPPPVSSIATPVPYVHAKPNPAAGRADPFVVLYAPPQSAPTNVTTSAKRVAVSSFPNIPTLPGFSGGPGGGGPWSGVRLSGVVQSGPYISAIIEADGKSYIARPGDTIASRYHVLAIGPSYVRLSSPDGVRTFSLGG